MKITVTKSDIKNGKSNYNTCPVALAIRRKTKADAIVYRTCVQCYGNDTFWQCPPLPVIATRFIDRFDSNKKVKPFSFNLKLK